MKKNWILSGVVGSIAAIVYFASMANYAFPGESAELMVQWRGLDTASSNLYPLMGVFAKLFGGGNLLAPVCGILAVILVYLLMASFVGWRIRNENAALSRSRLSHIAGAVAATVFMFTPAVHSAASHISPRLFDFTWALAAMAFTVPMARTPRSVAWLCPVIMGSMLAYGFCDSVIFAVLLPFFIAAIILADAHAGRRPYLSLSLFAATGLVTLFVALGNFDLKLAVCLKRAAAELAGYCENPGWLYILIFTTLPFVIALFSSSKAFNEKPGMVQWLFHVAMTFIAILAIATPLSPSSLMEPYGVMPVATSAYAAMVSGYLCAYWWHYRHVPVGIVSGAILTFVLVVTSLWNLFTFDRSAGDFADKLARRILRDLGDRTWFVTDGSLDSHLLLAAAETGQEFNLISLKRDLDTNYLAKLGDLVREKNLGGSKSGELQLSLTLGVLPFVQDWFAADPSVKRQVAIFGAPDLWYSVGITPVPEFCFFGADPDRQPNWEDWREFDHILSVPKGWGSYHDRNILDPVDRLKYSLRRHLGFVANNRGVYLQDLHREDEAFKFYELVLNEIDRDNICTIFNEVAMANAKHKGAMAKQRELERMLKQITDDKKRRYVLWRLGTYYGYIRNPEVFIQLGYAWARSGRPGDALSQIRRAIDFVPSDKRAVLMNMMAMLYANDNDQRKSRQLFESVLAKNGNDHDALIGLMRLELLDGNSAKALEYLKRAAESSGDGKQAKLELAMVAMMKNDLVRAKELIRKAIDFDPKDMQPWSLLAAVVIQQIDGAKNEKDQLALQKELENEILPQMEKQSRSQFDYYLQATKGFILLRQGDIKRREARDAFLAAAKERPDVAAMQDLVLGLDISLDDKPGAESHAREVLRRNRNAPLANYVMGSLALTRGNYRDAEAFLRKAANAPQPVALALNDLAEVLRRNKKYAEAEEYARKATRVAPTLYVAWETLGAILMDSNTHLDEAEAYVRKACDLSRSKDGKEVDVRMLVSLARVQLVNGDLQHAKITMRKIQSRVSELSAFEKREYEELKKRMR